MSITVGKLFANANSKFAMNLAAGQRGLNNLVEWVHIVEDSDVSKFLHGNEVVFTAGILNDNKEWIYDFAVRLHEVNTSAFVVNLGPYIKSIPQKVIDYCNEVNMPLYTIPWKTRMVDMTRDICHMIMDRENIEDSLEQTIKNVIFKIGDLETQILQLERYGYLRDSNFCFIAINFEDKKNEDSDEQNKIFEKSIKRYAEQIARSIKELYINFDYKDYQIFVLVDYSDYDIEKFVTRFWSRREIECEKIKMHMGISENIQGIELQAENFERALMARKMACRMDEHYIYYDKLDIYKILLNVKDTKLLKVFFDDTIGAVEKYDKENNTNLIGLLRTYMDSNGCIQTVSEKKFIHRNTVNNMLKKIEKITGHNPLNLNEKVRFTLGFYIQDIME